MDSFMEMLLPLEKISDNLKDGRIICIFRDGVRFYCRWNHDRKQWCLGVTPIIGATHYSIAALNSEMAIDITKKPKKRIRA